MTEMYEAGRRSGKTVESIAEVVRKAVGEGIETGVIKAPMLTPMYVGMDFATGGLIPKPKPEVHFWEDCKIQRNGKYTTVIWRDGTVTRVTCQDSDEPDDLRAFEEALAKKLYGSRTALKKFVEKRTVVQKKKGKKVKEEKKLESLHSCSQQINVGDAVFLSGKIFKHVEEKGRICKVTKIESPFIWLDGFDCGGRGLLASGMTKVRTEPPYSVGDWVVFRNPKENYLVHSEAWTSHMVADKPLRIEKINGTNLLCNDGCVYESLWVRGVEKTEEGADEWSF